MEKQIIKTIIGEKQSQIFRTELLQRNEHLDENSNHVTTN